MAEPRHRSDQDLLALPSCQPAREKYDDVVGRCAPARAHALDLVRRDGCRIKSRKIDAARNDDEACGLTRILFSDVIGCPKRIGDYRIATRHYGIVEALEWPVRGVRPVMRRYEGNLCHARRPEAAPGWSARAGMDEADVSRHDQIAKTIGVDEKSRWPFRVHRHRYPLGACCLQLWHHASALGHDQWFETGFGQCVCQFDRGAFGATRIEPGYHLKDGWPLVRHPAKVFVYL